MGSSMKDFIVNNRRTTSHEDVIRVGRSSSSLMVPQLNAREEDPYGEDDYWFNLMVPSWFQCGQKSTVGPEFIDVPAKRRRYDQGCTATSDDAITVGRFTFIP